VDLIRMAQNRDRRQALVNTVMSLLIPWKARNFLTKLATISLSIRTLLQWSQSVTIIACWFSTALVLSDLLYPNVFESLWRICSKWKLLNWTTSVFTCVSVFKVVFSLRGRLCGLVVSVADYKHTGPGFDSRALLRIFLMDLGLERGPLSLVIG
jgi:hypothetical protein